jgi:hypothetical protein
MDAPDFPKQDKNLAVTVCGICAVITQAMALQMPHFSPSFEWASLSFQLLAVAINQTADGWKNK